MTEREAFATVCLGKAEQHREEIAKLTRAYIDDTPLEFRDVLSWIIDSHRRLVDFWEQLAARVATSTEGASL